MAKNNNYGIQAVSLSDCWAFLDCNPGRFYRDLSDGKPEKVLIPDARKKRIVSIPDIDTESGIVDNQWQNPHKVLPLEFLKGFDASKGTLVAHRFDDLPNGDKLQKLALERRRGRVEEFRAKGNETITYHVESPHGNHIDEVKRGFDPVEKKITFNQVADLLESEQLPVYWIVSGQRRFFSWPFSIALHKKAIDYAGEWPEYQFQVDVRKFNSYVDTHQLLCEENSRGGKADYDARTRFYHMCMLVREQPSLGPTRAGRIVGWDKPSDNTARQKAYNWAMLDAKFPEIGICGRLWLKDNDPQHINYSWLHHHDGATLLGVTKKPAKDSIVPAILQDAKEADESHVREYLVAKATGVKPPKMFTAKELDNVIASFPNDKIYLANIRAVLEAVAVGDSAAIANLKKAAQQAA